MTLEVLKKGSLVAVGAVVTIIIFFVLSRQRVPLNHVKSPIERFCKNCVEEILTEESATNNSCEELISAPAQTALNLNIGIQLLAAAPGSGSAWCKKTISYITGYVITAEPGDQRKLESFYYKTHYPFQRVGNKYANTHPKRTMVLIRDPFDAGFSEYTRRSLRTRRGNQTGKYAGIEELSSKAYLAQTQPVSPSKKFAEQIKQYLMSWRMFHEYWLRTHTGNVQVVLYQDLVDDISKFTEITNYFGYDATLTHERMSRLECFYQVKDNVYTKRRPYSKVADSAKKVLRRFYAKQTHETKAYVESLLKQKFKITMIIRR